jgi:hypothetical protein
MSKFNGPLASLTALLLFTGAAAAEPSSPVTDAAQVARNKRIAEEFVKSIGRGKLNADLISEGLTGWTSRYGIATRNDIEMSFAPWQACFPDGLETKIRSVTAEDDRVAMETLISGKMKDGFLYSNSYSYLFFFVDGRINSFHEYMDTQVDIDTSFKMGCLPIVKKSVPK